MMRSRYSRCGLVALVLGVLGGALFTVAQEPIDKIWPSIETQLLKDHIIPGSALEQLIRNNQEFTMLRVGEAQDKIPVPLWLRVVYRKANPHLVFSDSDPTGGYPLVLKEAHEWMLHHQDLQPGKPEPDVMPSANKTNVGANVRVSGAQTTSRSESDIRIDFVNPSRVIGASNNINGSGLQAQFFSSNGGATWGQTTLGLAAGDAFHSDPTVDWTSDGNAWSTTLGINSTATQLRLRVYKSTNGGATWTFDSTASGTQTNVDKQMMWIDHSASSPFRNNIYLIWHNGAPAYMTRRAGSAGTFSAPLQVSGAETTGTSIGADVKTNANGDVFGLWPDTGSRGIYVVKSTNGGASYSVPTRVATTFDSYDIGVPAFNNRRILIYSSLGAYRTASKNNVYATWTDLSGETGCTSAVNEPGSVTTSNCKTRIWFSRSIDGGATWSAPVKINNQAGRNDQFNQWIAVDETNGQLGIMYYDTVGDVNRRKTDVWYQISTDDGATWSAATKVTTAQTDETIAGADSGNQYGDYNALTGYNGTFLPSWTDRRSGGAEEIWTAALTETACTPPAAPAGLTATAVGVGQINLSWGAVAGATEYHVLRSTTSGGPYSQIAITTATTYSDTGLTGGTTYFYVVRAFASCESANSNQASATAQSGGPCTTRNLYSNGFEGASGLSDWTKGTFVGGGSTTSWRGVQACSAQTGSNVFRYGGNGCTANYGNNDFNFAQPSGATGIAVPAGSSATTLTFGHRRRFESGFDGGTLAVSLNGTNYTFVPATAITAGAAYNGTVSNSCPPAGAAGAPIWTGIQSTFVSTTVDLEAVCNLISGTTTGCAGRTLFIAFTSITDCSTNDDGWFLDNVTVSSCTP